MNKQNIIRFIIFLLLAALLAGCTGRGAASSGAPAAQPSAQGALHPEDTARQAAAHLSLLPTAYPISEEFLQWGTEEIDPAFAQRLLAPLEAGTYSDGLFYSLFGQSLHVLYDRYTGAIDTNPYIHQMPAPAGAPTLAFTGDINLADTWENMQVFHASPGGLADCVTQPLLNRMQAADVLLVNNEFTFSDRGSPMQDKLYTFRAATANVELLQEMGVDLVSLANNHVYDYGEEAFLDTLATLQTVGIPYVGAGVNLAEAMQPQYFIVGGVKVAYVAASRAEKYILTPGATDSSSGVLRCYDEADVLAAVATARANADLVVVYPHWGTENTHVLEDVQVSLAHSLIDAGADLVVGAHPHQLQGIEYYNGKPIVYSLGNFWFNTDRVDTALLEVYITSPNEIALSVVACLQTGGRVSLLEDATDQRRIFDLLEAYSEGGIQILDSGRVLPTS